MFSLTVSRRFAHGVWGCRGPGGGGQSRKEAFDQRKRDLRTLGLGQDGRPLKEQGPKKGRGKVRHAPVLVALLVSLCYVGAVDSRGAWHRILAATFRFERTRGEVGGERRMPS